ncbi:MAG: hypothetical protein ACYTE8_01995 [Planctomycetota bacterium]
MKKPLSIVFVLVFLASPSYGKYSGGDGSVGDPFQIASPNDLNSVGDHSEDWNKHFILTADINVGGFTGAAFNIIGRGVSPFTGSFRDIFH